MAAPIMMLGTDFKFAPDIGSFERLQRRAEWRWEKVDRIGRNPAMQFQGPDAKEIEIAGVILPLLIGRERRIEDLLQLAGAAEPLDLIDGDGWVYGLYVLTKLEESRSRIIAGGLPLTTSFTATLIEYGEDA